MDNDEIKTLLDALERMSKLYHYIPEERQKEIIQNCLLTDKEYQNINVRTVAKWLELNGKQYFQEEAHKPSETLDDYVKGEARDEWLKVWAKSLANMNEAYTSATKTGGSGTRLRESLGNAGAGQAWRPYLVDGIEVYAPSQEEAEKMIKG